MLNSLCTKEFSESFPSPSNYSLRMSCHFIHKLFFKKFLKIDIKTKVWPITEQVVEKNLQH